jgi:hypothetical protein
MAKVVSHSVTVTFSSLVKDSEVVAQDFFTQHLVNLDVALDEVFANSGLVVEVEPTKKESKKSAQG